MPARGVGAARRDQSNGLRREESQRVPAGREPWEKHCRTECLPAAQENLSPRRAGKPLPPADAIVRSYKTIR